MLGCPIDPNSPRSFTPRTFAMVSTIPSAAASFLAMSGPYTLTLFSPFTPESASSTLSEMYCEKLKITPGNPS